MRDTENIKMIHWTYIFNKLKKKKSLEFYTWQKKK